jgi:hypothetical protein
VSVGKGSESKMTKGTAWHFMAAKLRAIESVVLYRYEEFAAHVAREGIILH